MPSYGDIWNQRKTIIPLVASMRTKVNGMLITVYDDDNTVDMYIAVGLVFLVKSV